MKQKILNFEEEQYVIEAYRNFIPVPEISEQVGVNKKNVYKTLKKYNVELHGEKKKIQDEDRVIIAQRYANGETIEKLADEYKVGLNTIIKCLRENNVSTRSKSEAIRRYHVNENYFDVIDTPEKAYLIGLYWSDGCNKRDRNSVSITFQESDKQLLEDIKKLLDADYSLHYINNSDKPNKQSAYTLDINNKHMSERLEELGMVANKSLVLKFPTWLDKSLYKSMILGIIDGDGHIAKYPYKYLVSLVGTEDICTHIQDYILHELGVNSTIYNVSTNNTKALHIVGKQNCKIFLDWLYEGSTIRMQRKYEIYLNKYCSEDTNNLLSA